MPRAADLTPYLTRLEELPFVRDAKRVPPRPGAGRADEEPQIAVKTPQGTRRCPIDLRASHLGREVAERIVQLHRETPDRMIFAPHVGRELGELFARAGVNFIDLAGNCHVRFGDAYLARVQGLTTASPPAPSKGMRAPAYSALLALLLDEALLEKSTRAIAEAAGNISPQTAADLRARLLAQGDVLRTRGAYRWSPNGRARALDGLLGGWSATLVPHLLLGRFRARERELAALEARLSKTLDAIAPWRWGGGAAAQRLTGFFRGDDTTIYVADPPADLARQLGLVPDREGPIALLSAPVPGAFVSPVAGTVHPLLVYADLLASGDERAREAAHEVHTRFLAPTETRA